MSIASDDMRRVRISWLRSQIEGHHMEMKKDLMKFDHSKYIKYINAAKEVLKTKNTEIQFDLTPWDTDWKAESTYAHSYLWNARQIVKKEKELNASL